MKINRSVNSLLLFCCFICSFLVKSEHNPNATDIIWVTDAWQNYTNEDGTGLYHELFETIFKDSPFSIHVKYLPWKRALRQVGKKKAQISGALPHSDKYLFADIPILTQPISILCPKTAGNLTLEKISSLVGVWPQTYAEELMQPAISKHINGVSAHYRKDAMFLIKMKKVDYYIDIRPMLEMHLSELPETEQQQYQIQDLTKLNLFLIFSDDLTGRALKRYYDRKTQQLLEQNILQTIYQKYHLSFTFPD